jgi:hypothetical protein
VEKKIFFWLGWEDLPGIGGDWLGFICFDGFEPAGSRLWIRWIDIWIAIRGNLDFL